MIHLGLILDVPVQIPSSFWYVIIVGGAGVVVLGALKQLFRTRRGGRAIRRGSVGVRFERCGALLTQAELDFLWALEQSVGNQFRIAMKVRLGDLVRVPGWGSESATANNKVDRKHVDFVLCSVQEVYPMLVIELDDSSHGRADRIERDEFVNGCLEVAGIRVLRVPCRRSYDARKLAGEIRACLER